MRTHRLGQGVLAVCLLIVCQFGFAKPRDPAPIPDEVLQKLVANHPTEARDELAENLSAQVTETEQLARELTTELYRDAAAAGKGGRASAAEGKQAQLMGKRSEWLNWRGEVERRVEQAKAELLDRGLTDQADAWSRHAAQLENRFRDLDEAFARLDRSVDRRQRRDAAVALKSLLRGLGPRSDAGQLPLESQQIHTVAPPPEPTPQQETDEIPQYLSDQRRVAENLYAYAGDLLLAAAPVTPPEATSCSYTSADLAATSDAPQTPEIQALAKSLDYSPRKIYQYVYNEIAFELYYGSLKGAQGTLLAKAGGSTDQASLLIALLRASNIPSRYVKGQIWVLDQTPAPVDGRAPRWVGAKSYTAAGKILATGYNPVAGAISTALGQGITATQVWVEACVPYGHYRGVPLDNAGHRWIPMDPSFKDMRYQPGIANNVTFDATGYLAQRTFELPHEWYERQVDAAIKGANPAVMLWDAPYRGEIEPRPLDILPASLPYLVSGFRSWAGTTSPETAELPASHRYQLDVNVNGTTLTSATLALPQVALSRVSLSFKGATAADQTALDAWRNDGNLGSALTCGNVVHVTPVVKVDGAEQTPAATPAAVDVCSTTNSLTLTVSLPELTNPVVNIAPFKTIAAANIDVLAFYARQSSDALLTHRVVRLLNAVTATANPNANLEETEGELLNLIGLKYFRHVADSRQYIAGLDGGSGDSGPMLGRVSSGSKVVYLFDLPFAVVRSAFVVDIPSALDSNLDLTSGQLVWKTYQETGYQDSSLEHYIWQENLRMEAISTVRGLQVANETGVGTVQVNAANWAAVRPLLSVYPGASASDCTYSLGSLQYPRCIIDDTARPNSTASLVSLGHTVTLPVSLLQYGSYKGWVQMAERQTANAADSGMCAIAPFCTKFLISGNYSGGYTTTANPAGWNYDPVLGTGFQSGANTPTILNPAGQPPVYVGGSGIGPGADPRNRWSASVASLGSGIPGLRSGVNRVTGNYYQKESDLAIAGRGGLPFRFERSYNSRNAKDGPLGYGWTHGFNQALKFYGVEGGLAKVGWVDGTGAQRFFATAAHAAGNINAGAVLTNPEGVYVKLERISGGADNLKYRLTDHNGLVYVFESQTGPNTPPALGAEPAARLLAIQDRNGNALTLSYNTGCGNYLCSVKDALNRSLTFTYTAGHITQVSDWAGRQRQYAYDANGNLQTAKRPLEVADPVNHPATVYAYYTAADGPNLNHALKSYTQPKGNGVRFEYYANGRLFREYPFDATGSRTAEAVSYRYNDFRRETITTNARGASRTDRFDAWGNPVKSIDETGAVTQYAYDPAKPYNRLTETDPLGQVTSYAYDANGNVTLKTLPSKLTNSSVNDTIGYGSFTAFNQPQWVKDARGNYAVLKYDAKGNLTETLRLRAGVAAPSIPYTPVAADLVAWTVNGYDAFGNPTTIKRVRNFAGQIATPAGDTGPLITYGYDANSLYPVSVSRHGDRTGDGVADLPDDSAALVFDSLGRQTQGIDTDWQRIDSAYDADNRLVRASDAFGQLRDLTYDKNGNLEQEKLNLTVNGKPTLVDSKITGHDRSDRIDARIDAGGNVTGYDYDAQGNLQGLTDPDGFALTYDYDEADRLTGVADTEGRTVITERDGAGRTKSVTDPNGNTWSRSYWDSTRAGRLKRISEPQLAGFVQARARELDYDAHANVIQSTDMPADAGANRVSLSRYDALDRVVRQVGPVYTDSDPNSASYNQSIRPVTIQRYSALGYLVEVKAGKTALDGGLNVDPNTGASASDTVATQVTYGYDDFGRKLSETDGLGQTTTWTYDAQNNPKTQVTPNPGGHTLTYAWDYGHQLLSLNAEDGRKIAFSRNPLGQPTRAETWSNATTLLVAYDSVYDAAHRLQTVTDSRGPKTLSYDRSPAGRLNWVLDSDGNRTDYRYDGSGRLDGVWTPNYDFIQFERDGAGRLSQKRYPNGVTATYSWNPDNSLQQVSHALGATILAQSTYGYDGYGSRNGLTETLSGLPTLGYGYQYDGLNRLIQVDNGTASQRESYGYDPLGNRVQKQIGNPVTATTAYRYDAANQLTEIRQNSLAGALLEADLYDGSGNRIRQCTGAGVTRPSNASCTGSSQATQGWNSFGQLSQYAGTITASFEYDDQGRRISKTEGATTTHILYDGADIHGEYATPSALPSAVYTFAFGLDKPLSRISGTTSLPGATARYYHEDGLGSLIATTGQTMTPTPDVTTQRFNAWGSKLGGSGAVPTFGYTGREPDSTGLMYYRARYYDSGIGRFASRDPIGLPGGINRYIYVLANPINFVDALGLETDVVVNTNGIGHVGVVVTSGADTLIYDPGGTFPPAGVNSLYEGKTFSLKDYVDYQLEDGSNVNVFRFPTTPDEEALIRENIEYIGGCMGGLCSTCSGMALRGVGPFKNLGSTLTPWGMKSELQDLKDVWPDSFEETVLEDPNAYGGGGTIGFSMPH